MAGIFKRLFGAKDDPVEQAPASGSTSNRDPMPEGMPASIEEGMEWQATDRLPGKPRFYAIIRSPRPIMQRAC